MALLTFPSTVARPSAIVRIRLGAAMDVVDPDGARCQLPAGEYHLAADGDEMIVFEHERCGLRPGLVRRAEFWSALAAHPLSRVYW